MIHYQIIPVDPKAHLFAVTMTLSQPKPVQVFSLPAWLPGSYMVRDFAKNIIELKAQDAQGQTLKLTQLDKQTWSVDNNSSEIILTYQVYAWDLSVRTAHLDMTHGFFNGSSVFLSAHGFEDTLHTVSIDPPTEPTLSDWRLATSITRTSGDDFAFGQFSAKSYDELIDHPVEMGLFTLGSFDACGVRHDIVLNGRHRACMPRLCQDLKAICEYQINFFGTPAPFKRYLFMTTVLDNGFGGLEHRASTALMCSRKDLPLSLDMPINNDYRTYLSLCSHEYFHSWNVKRIKPECFLPYKLEAETYTPQLWAYEGITSYYDDFLTYRAGLVDEQSYLDMLSETFTRVYRSQGRFKQSVKDSSFNAWTKFYKQDENAQNAIISYYTKGALFALYLDLTLRSETQGKYNLDHVMQILWQEYALQDKGTTDTCHQAIVERLLGRDCQDLFAYLDSTDDIPLAALLAEFGVNLSLRSSQGAQDVGGGQAKGYEIAFGAKTQAAPIGLKIVTVTQGSPAHLAGLSAGDVLIAADNLQVTGQFEAQLQQYPLGESLNLHWFRRDELMTGELTVAAAPKDTVALSIRDKSKIVAWLGR
ncbi:MULTISPECIES: M61 family metallopeptidase [unclassified Shewanella]|uniref:M61 family metallopeptidase n=1 Tax=Shewanella TaxID=22 RepID=UPI0021DA0F1C|nr:MULTISPECIES: PDZ domain-containing protein [unclassified Shewanella]MCU7984710.1 peptidase M61 [Shewanella sp. SW24]MCU8022352.1 peptidase M61 [Shewanella sp. SM78]MCU8042944.1 peptidase M61 [Shewanella sp. SM68]MCU8047319.1 peptidase M61 [Shewanella sp. SM65]MCU8078402.1 peptidase M61 [Shewanella sp. SM103]